MTRSRYRIFEEHRPHFLTCTIVAWLPVLAYPRFADIILESWRFLQKQADVRIYGFVIMENHLHWIAAAERLPDRAAQFKSFTARKIIDGLGESGFETLLEELRYFKERHKLGQEYQLWQEGSHPQELAHPAVMRQKLDYIHLNPVRRGYVDYPIHWRYSSARNYAGGPGVIEVVTEW